MYVYVFVCMCMSVCMYICVYMCVYVCVYMYVCVYIYQLYCTCRYINQLYCPYRYILELYSFVSVCVCVKDTCWKFSIYYKFTIKELLKLTKGITWRHSNIVLKLEKMKFTNTLKNNVQLGNEINDTKGTKQLQNKKNKH